MTFAERLARISPFRWRLEWALLLAASASLVIGEQAREALTREPATIARDGVNARASLLAARLLQHSERIVRGEPRLVVQTRIDLEWRDTSGQTRRVEDYLLPEHIAADLGIEAPARRWPEYVNILYLPAPVTTAHPVGANAEAVLPSSIVGPQCRPNSHCALVVLASDGRSIAHEELERIELALAVAPWALWLSLAGFLVNIFLRLAGVVNNRSSLEW